MAQKTAMERNSLGSNSKDHSIDAGRLMRDRSNKKVKDSWNCSSDSHGGDLLDGFSWPPRSYTCRFCKREFRSAQALGGHMNVHRRDRVRLRQSPPRDGQYSLLDFNLNLDPNPNPHFSSSPKSSSPTNFLPFISTLPPLVSPSLSSPSSPSLSPSSEIRKWNKDGTLIDHLTMGGANLVRKKTMKTLFGVEEFDGFTQESDCKSMKKADIVRSDLGIGLLKDSKEDLDLELRLGCS